MLLASRRAVGTFGLREAAMRIGELLGIALIALMPANVGGQGRPFGSAEASAAGQAVMSAQIARYGRLSNPAWDQVISSVLSKLQRATGFPGLQVGYVVVGNGEQNAAAVPGAKLVVNAGILRLVQDLAARVTRIPTARRERFPMTWADFSRGTRISC